MISIENTKITKIKEDGNNGVYSIEPLPTGFGATLGNTLRRVLLTSIRGAGVTQVKINGASHQFTTLPGIKEDVVELTLNLKKLRFKLHGNEPVLVTLNKKGPGDVTAADLKLTSDAEIMNKDQHIANLANNKTEFSAELTVEAGVGYSPMEERVSNKVGVIVLDTLFSPIVSASYEVESTRFGQKADLDKLVLSLQTDGSIAPREAIDQSLKMLRDYYDHLLKDGALAAEVEEVVSSKDSKVKSTENIAVDELPLQTRTVNALKKHGIETLQQLGALSDDEITDIKNLGDKSISEIKKLLEKEGYR